MTTSFFVVVLTLEVHLKRKQKSYKRLFLIGIGIIASVFVMGWFQEEESKPFPSELLRTQTSAHTEAEAHRFWDEHLRGLILDQLIQKKYPIAFVNEALETISNRPGVYSGTYQVSPCACYHATMRDALMSTDTDSNPRKITISVYKSMDIYNAITEPNKKLRFELEIVSAFVHEFNHIAFSPSGTVDPVQRLEEESRIMFETTDLVLAKFVEAGYPLGPSDSEDHKVWLTCGKKNNTCWRSYVNSLYGDHISSLK